MTECAQLGCCFCFMPDRHQHCFRHAPYSEELRPYYPKACSPCHSSVFAFLQKSYINQTEMEYHLFHCCWTNIQTATSWMDPSLVQVLSVRRTTLLSVCLALLQALTHFCLGAHWSHPPASLLLSLFFIARVCCRFGSYQQTCQMLGHNLQCVQCCCRQPESSLPGTHSPLLR